MKAEITKQDEIKSVEGLDKLSFWKTLIQNEKVQLVEWIKKKGSWADSHEHKNEEMLCYCISGSMREVINGKEYVFQKGDAWYLPLGTTHSCVFLEDSMILTIFFPPNKSYNQNLPGGK